MFFGDLGPWDRAKYVLFLFDNSRLHQHLDAVQSTWSPQAPGSIGRRWAEALCAAAWRIIVLEEGNNPYSNNFALRDEALDDE